LGSVVTRADDRTVVLTGAIATAAGSGQKITIAAAALAAQASKATVVVSALLPNKTFTVTDSANPSAAPPNSIYKITGNKLAVSNGTVFIIYDVPNSMHQSSNLLDFLNLSGVNPGDQITFDAAVNITKIKNAASTPSSVIELTNGNPSLHFSSMLTLEGSAADSFKLGSTAGLNIPAGNSLTITDTVVTIPTTPGHPGLSFYGAPGAGGARLAGTGAIVAGNTRISGDWQAVGAAGGWLMITAGTTGSTAGFGVANGIAIALTAKGPGAKITQQSGAGNRLDIGTNITIDLGGSAANKLGSIELKGAAADAGHISLSASANIKTGNSDGGVPARELWGGPADSGTAVISGLADNRTNGMLNAKAKSTAASGAPGKLVEISGSGHIQPGGIADVSLDSETAITVTN
jgi:hypothetical protein